MATEPASHRCFDPAAVLGAAAALAVALSGCSVIGGPEIPPGFATTEVQGLQVSHPPGWSVEEQELESGDATGDVVSAQTAILLEEDGLVVASVDAVYALDFAARPESAVDIAISGRFGVAPEYEHEISEIEGRGAEYGNRIDWSFIDEDGEFTGQVGAEMDGVDIVLVDDNSLVHHVVISWMNGELDPDIADQIAGSVYLND